MSLPNYLAQIKSSGIYRFVWDKSEIAGVPAEILRLVVGYSEKGPFNTPVYIKSDTEFKAIFGDISKKMEKRGIFFHRMALQCLAKGPIIVLNLKKFENEEVKASSFNVEDATIDLTGVKVESIYDTTRFWKLDPEAILPATIGTSNDPEKKTKYISITSADSRETSCSLFIRGYKPSGYDVTVTNWYSSQGEDVPDYFVTADGRNYSSLLISDFWAEIYVFRGEFTPAMCVAEPLNKYFDVIAGKPQLKEYIVNAFGEKVDTLAALAADDASNFVNSYSGCLLPYFKSQTGSYVSLDLAFNSDNGLHKMMMNLNSDLLYGGDLDVNKLVTTGWTDTTAFGAPLKHTTEVYKSTPAVENTVKDGDVDIFVGKTYNFTYSDEAGKEATAFDPDFIEYVGGAAEEGETDDFVKYIGGKAYKFVEQKPVMIGGVALTADVYTFEDEDDKYSAIIDGEPTEIDFVAIYNGDTYIAGEETEFVKSDMPLVDLATLPVINPSYTVYSFTSYPSETSTEEYATGTVKELRKVAGCTEVQVLTNTVPGFEGNVYRVKATDLSKVQPEDRFQLFEENTTSHEWEPVDVWVGNIETVAPDTTYYRYEGEEEGKLNGKTVTFKVYITANSAHTVIEGADNIYVKGEDVYLKSEGSGSGSGEGDDAVYTQIEDVKADKVIDGTDQGALDFVAVGLLVGDRVLYHDIFYTITDLSSDFLKIIDVEGNEKVLTRKDTVKKCNHSASITNFQLKPFYFEGYEYEHSEPAKSDDRDWDKLQWHKFILSTLIDYEGLRIGLTSRTDIDYRYIVDTFEGLVDTEEHKELALICKQKDNAVGFLNFPSMKTFKNCEYSKFVDDNGKLQVKYIAEGANKKKAPGLLFSLVSELNGGSYVSYNTPMIFSDGTVKTIVPSAALVSNNFMEKYESRQPYYIVAGPTYGRMIYSGLVGPEYNFTRADLDILEPMGVNCMVYVPRLGTYINSNQTAKQNPVTALSKLHVRELVIYLQDEIEKLLQDYQWEFNTPYLRDLVKAKADTICERVKNNGGLYEYLNVCDESNNTDDVINNEMFVLSTSIEPGMGCGKMVQELTIYKKGQMSAIIK